jgi:hypothetical protein
MRLKFALSHMTFLLMRTIRISAFGLRILRAAHGARALDLDRAVRYVATQRIKFLQFL